MGGDRTMDRDKFISQFVKHERMSDSQKRAINLKGEIEKACIKNNLNLTIYNGMIGFVDQTEGKIVMVWDPEYHIQEK